MIDRLAEVTGRPVSRETFAQIERYAALLSAASEQHNLIAASTLDDLWERHIADSAQLVRFEPKPGASWIDIGSGAGLPGIVVALLTEGPMTLVEPRRLRVDFLRQVIDELGLGSRVRLVHGKADKASGKFDVITARAVAPTRSIVGDNTPFVASRDRLAASQGEKRQIGPSRALNGHGRVRFEPRPASPIHRRSS